MKEKATFISFHLSDMYLAHEAENSNSKSTRWRIVVLKKLQLHEGFTHICVYTRVCACACTYEHACAHACVCMCAWHTIAVLNSSGFIYCCCLIDILKHGWYLFCAQSKVQNMSNFLYILLPSTLISLMMTWDNI